VGRKKTKPSLTRRLHRTIGATAALFVLLMVLSGLALNHTDGLGLDKTHLSPAFLLEWYGLGTPDDIRNYRAGDHWLSVAGSQLFLDGRAVAGPKGVVGASSSEGFVVVAGRFELVLFDPAGLLIEKISWEHPEPIDSIGSGVDEAIIVSSNGKLWQADAQLLGWTQPAAANGQASWSTPQKPPKAILDSVTDQYRGSGLSLERVLLDLHSGRIFGSAGTLLYDLLALAVGFLAISGLIVWASGRKNGKARHSKR